MSPLTALRSAIARLVHRRSDDDFRDEIEAHLAIEADRLRAEHDLSIEDARNAARRAFGNVGAAKERFYDSRRPMWLDRTMRHVTYAWRGLLRRPALSLAIVLTLAVGIGFNSSVFTLFYSLAYRALPLRGAERFVNVYQLVGGKGMRWIRGQPSFISYDEFKRYQRGLAAIPADQRALEATAAYQELTVSFDEASRKTTKAEYVSCEYFATVGVRLALGRPFSADECTTLGGAPSAVVGYDVWQNDLSGAPDVIGKQITLNRIRFTVVGVAEQSYSGLLPAKTRLWIPVTMQPAIDHGRDSVITHDASWLMMIGRLAPNATVERAREQLVPAARAGDAEHPGRETRVFAVKAAYLNAPDVRKQSSIAIGVVFTLGALAIGVVCANVMSLLLARGLARRREIAIRLAIGASRRQIVEQLLVESLLLALIGGALGFALAFTVPAIVARMFPPNAPDFQLNLTPDLHVLAFTAGVALVAAFVCGLMPALQATNLNLAAAWTDGAVGARMARPSRLRGAIVGVQVAGSALLLIVGGLLTRAVARGASIDPGYATQNVVSFELNLRALDYDATRANEVLTELTRRALAIPDVEDAALVTRMPLLGRESRGVAAADDASRDTKTYALTAASGRIFPTLGIHMVAGRGFTDDEMRTASEPPAVISEALAKRFWPNDAAAAVVGRRIRIERGNYVITGVAANARYTSLAEENEPFVYRALPRDDLADAHVVIRARDAATIARIERELPGWAAESDQAIVAESERFTARVALSIFPARMAAVVASAIGGLALVLAVIGIYGVVSYAVTQRRREIAIRLALGSSRQGVVALMMRQSGRPATIGLLSGLVVAIGVAQVIRSLLMGVSAFDPVAYVSALLALGGAAAIAAYLPSQRAARIDPGMMLRED